MIFLLQQIGNGIVVGGIGSTYIYFEYGYDGGFSMEPHVAAVFHEEAKEDSASLDKIKYESYVEYGRRFEKLLRDCGWEF